MNREEKDRLSKTVAAKSTYGFLPRRGRHVVSGDAKFLFNLPVEGDVYWCNGIFQVRYEPGEYGYNTIPSPAAIPSQHLKLDYEHYCRNYDWYRYACRLAKQRKLLHINMTF